MVARHRDYTFSQLHHFPIESGSWNIADPSLCVSLFLWMRNIINSLVTIKALALAPASRQGCNHYHQWQFHFEKSYNNFPLTPARQPTPKESLRPLWLLLPWPRMNEACINCCHVWNLCFHLDKRIYIPESCSETVPQQSRPRPSW